VSPYGYPHTPATFVLSLEVRDVKTVGQCRENLLGVHRAVPALLVVFAENCIHATWTTVGFLFFSDRAELLASLPDLQPKLQRNAPLALPRYERPGQR